MSSFIASSSRKDRLSSVAHTCFWTSVGLLLFGTACYLASLAGWPTTGLSYLGWISVPYAVGWVVTRFLSESER